MRTVTQEAGVLQDTTLTYIPLVRHRKQAMQRSALRVVRVVTTVDGVRDQGFAVTILIRSEARNTLHLAFKLHAAQSFLIS